MCTAQGSHGAQRWLQVVKNVTQTQDAEHAHIRVTFNFGGAAYEPYQRHAPHCVFLKELSFR